MLSSRSVDYAIAAMNHIARSTARPHCRAGDIAQEMRSPAPYTAKVLQILALSGLLNSTRGRKGGFTLTEKSWSITIGQLTTVLHGKIEFPIWLGADLTDRVKKRLKELVVVGVRKP